MPDSIGQTVNVDNRGGATGTIAAAMVAKAPADGYTIMMVPSGPHTISASAARHPALRCSEGLHRSIAARVR